jgi:hypothetical protein
MMITGKVISLHFLLTHSLIPHILCSFLLKNIPLFSSNQQWIDTNPIDQYYRSCWLPIVSIIGPKKLFFSDKIEPSA